MLLFFILGDLLGGGIYALVGSVAGKVGGAIWMAFGLAFLMALLTAAGYAELSTKYPRAGGAAFYVNRAFGLPPLTFLVTFAVMASGVTSASALARAFSGAPGASRETHRTAAPLPHVGAAEGACVVSHSESVAQYRWTRRVASVVSP